VPDQVREEMTFRPVETVDQVLAVALSGDAAEEPTPEAA
jgi:hypothetical protein